MPLAKPRALSVFLLVLPFYAPLRLAARKARKPTPDVRLVRIWHSRFDESPDLNTFIAIPISTTSGRGLDFDLSIYYNSLLWYPSAGQWTLNYGWDLNSLDGGSATYTTTSSQQNCGPAAPSKGPMWLPTTALFLITFARGALVRTTARNTDTRITCIPSPTAPSMLSISAAPRWLRPRLLRNSRQRHRRQRISSDATVSQDPTARDRSGTLLFLNGTVMKDRNGNFISYSTPGGGETDYTDSAGHLALKMIPAVEASI